ncbi:MAG: hypothetical protein IJ218_05015 [Alphaproteobacteria bacterium]|nr:hypothetical protein [Alphaproteobacteria bacterium]
MAKEKKVNNTVKTPYKETGKKSGFKWVEYLFVIVLFGVFGWNIKHQQVQINKLQQQIAQIQYVYVYDLEEVLRGVRLDDLNREFEAKINILNNEVSSAQDKISNLKNSKVKDDFSDVYLKSLKLKRDSMIQEYSRTLQNITAEINEKVTELAQEKGAPVVFDRRFITARTPLVIDLTDEIIGRIKLMRPRILDE